MGLDLSGRRILVVGINYAPEHTGIAPYTTQASEYFRSCGADVQVLTGIPHYPHWSIPAEYRGRLATDEERHGVRLRRLRHFVPSQQSALRRGWYEATYGAQVLRQSPRPAPDIVLAVIPSLLGAFAAGSLARRSSARLVHWVQDLMGPATAQSGIAGGGRVAAATERIEGRTLRAADTVIVLNDAFRRYAAGVGVPEDRIVIRPNWTHLTAVASADRESVRSRLGWRRDETIVLHSGNMGLKQDLGNVVRAAAAAEARAARLRFVLMGDGSQRDKLARDSVGVAGVQFLPPADSASFVDVLAAADLLLVNELPTAVDMSLPSKLTSYFRAGRPVVAAVPLGGGTAAEVARSGGGVVVEPGRPERLVEAIVGIAADPATAGRMSTAAKTYADEQLASGPALQALAQAVVGSGTSPNTSA